MSEPVLQFEVFTLLPEVFEPYLASSILQRARQRGVVEVRLHNIRDWTTDRHHITDDEPYGGGGGMVMKPEPIFAAVEEVLGVAAALPADPADAAGTGFQPGDSGRAGLWRLPAARPGAPPGAAVRPL